MLILSESTYSWRENGKLCHPKPSHPTENLNLWGIENFGKRGYYTAMGRALCRKKQPSSEELRQAWDEYAYSPFVQDSVGEGAKSRPRERHWQDAGPVFLSLIEDIHPLKVLVTGKTMWNKMPHCTGPYLCSDLQAYKLKSGDLVWCLATPHPSSRKKGEGFDWERIGRAIRAFRLTEFPLRDTYGR